MYIKIVCKDDGTLVAIGPITPVRRYVRHREEYGTFLPLENQVVRELDTWAEEPTDRAGRSGSVRPAIPASLLGNPRQVTIEPQFEDERWTLRHCRE